jgi:hypothetical protein
MSKKLISTLLIIGGLVLALVFIFADLLALGGDLEAFGWKQITGTVVGALVFLVGLWLRFKGSKK